MTYVVPKNVVVQMGGTLDATTLCGLPCDYYLDYDNLNNLPPSLPVPTQWVDGDVLQFDDQGNMVWAPAQINNSSIDGGSAAASYTASAVDNTINGGGA